MKSLRNLIRVVLLLIIITIATAIVVPAQEAEGELKIITGPYLQHVTQTSIAIMWETNQPSNSVGKYAKHDGVTVLENSVTKEGMTTIHEIVFEGLTPGSSYFYRVISANENEKIRSETYTFKTAVRADSPFAFVVMGDNRTYPERFTRICNAAYAERPDFVINSGDVVSTGGVKDQWIREFLRPAAELMHRVPTYVAIGNHEENTHWYYDYVSYPEPENYYSFDFGNAHFAIIDSNKHLSPGSKQYKWLEQDLSQSNARWKFVVHHHPPYSTDDDYGDLCTGTRGDLNPRQLIPLYEKYGVDIVWSGHIHNYERSWPIKDGEVNQSEGVIYIVTGGAGAELESFLSTRSWFTAKIKQDWHYCLVTIHEGTLRMMAYDIDGRLFDYLELTKTKGGPKIEYSDLKVPSSVNSGEAFNVYVTITNKGEIGGAEAKLYIDGELVESKKVVIKKSEKVCFTLTLYEFGDHEIIIAYLEPKTVKVTTGAPF